MLKLVFPALSVRVLLQCTSSIFMYLLVNFKLHPAWRDRPSPCLAEFFCSPRVLQLPRPLTKVEPGILTGFFNCQCRQKISVRISLYDYGCFLCFFFSFLQFSSVFFSFLQWETWWCSVLSVWKGVFVAKVWYIHPSRSRRLPLINKCADWTNIEI